MNIRINFDYYDQILNVYGKIISKKQTSNTETGIKDCTSNSLINYVNVYVSKSIIALKKVIQLALSSNNENLAFAALEVFNYLTVSKQTKSDYNGKCKNHFDDAWLIHNFTNYCIDKGYFQKSAFKDAVVDNTKIDAYISNKIDENIYSKPYKALTKIIKDFQI